MAIDTTDATHLVSETLESMMVKVKSIRHYVFSNNAIVQGRLFSAIDYQEITTKPASELFIEAIIDWNTPDESLNGSVNRYPGVFEVSDELYEALQGLNEAKAKLEATVKLLENAGYSASAMRQIYSHAGHPRVHPLQAWRRIMLLDQGLESIGFTVAKRGSGSESIAFADAIERLTNSNAIDLVEQLQGYPETSQFRWIEPVSAHIRANIVYEGGLRKQHHASMPLCVPVGGWPCKRVRFNEPRVHKERKDKAPGNSIPLPFREGAFLQIA